MKFFLFIISKRRIKANVLLNVTYVMNKALGRFGQSRQHFPAERRISVELMPETRREAEISRYVN